MTRSWGIAALLVLAGTFASAAPPRGKKAPPARTQPPNKPAPEPDAPVQPRAEPKRAAPGGIGRVRTTVGLGVGGFTGGGMNRGPAAEASLTFTPEFLEGRLALDVELGWRMARFSAPVEGYGTLASTLHASPLAPALRFTLVRTSVLLLDVRGGMGALFLLHHLTSDYDAGATRFAVGWEAFVGPQLRVPLAPVELVLDVRLGLGEAHVPRLLGRAAGVQGTLGVRVPLS